MLHPTAHLLLYPCATIVLITILLNFSWFLQTGSVSYKFWDGSSKSLLTPISRTISRKYRDRIIVARWSKRSNMDFGRTTVKTTIYSHDGQKDLFVIFDGEAAKMGEISKRDNFETTGVMFRSENLSRAKMWKFDPFRRLSKCDPRFW